MASKYFSEKGKNLATKEDIAEITEKIEAVKNHYNQRHLLSKTYIEKQLKAYDELDALLYEFRLLYYSNWEEEYGELEFFNGILNGHDKIAQKVIHFNEKYSLYISEAIDDSIVQFSGACVHLSILEASSSPDKIKDCIDDIYETASSLRGVIKSEIM